MVTEPTTETAKKAQPAARDRALPVHERGVWLLAKKEACEITAILHQAARPGAAREIATGGAGVEWACLPEAEEPRRPARWGPAKEDRAVSPRAGERACVGARFGALPGLTGLPGSRFQK